MFEVNCNGTPETTTVSVPLVAVFCGLALSATCTVKLNVPAAVGVPLKMPDGLSVIPAGNVPEARDHVSVPTPPRSRSSCVYGCPCVALASEVVVTAKGVSGAVL